MPRTRSELKANKSSFYDVVCFPGVLGLVHGTYIPIIAPPEDEYAYINRKNFHSINVQGICNAEMIFTDVNAQWPGGHHDSFILNESTIHDSFERGDYGEGWLLGDSGYGLKRWLMTPIATPVTNQQRKYNLSHRKTRCPIERSFGALKSRWRIIDHSGGRLCYLPEKVAKITVTCCVLHNICIICKSPIIARFGPVSHYCKTPSSKRTFSWRNSPTYSFRIGADKPCCVYIYLINTETIFENKRIIY